MPYDEVAAARVRPLLADQPGLSEKKMFGGVGFLLHGNMCCGIWKDLLIVRVGIEAYPSALAEADTREFDITGRPMRGWVMVEPKGFASYHALENWLQRAVAFTSSLAPK